MLESKTKIWMVGGTIVLTIPGGVAKDSNFPFKITEKEDDNNKTKSIEPISVNIKVVKNKLIVEKIREDN